MHTRKARRDRGLLRLAAHGRGTGGAPLSFHPIEAAPSTLWEAYGLAAVQVVEWAEGDKRLYYSCRELLPGRNAKGEQNVASRLCLAKSADGKTWHRPALGLIEHPPGSGNTSNNIVWPPTHPNGSVASPFSPMSFFRDTNPAAREDERWIVIGQIVIGGGSTRGGKSGGVAWATTDGLRFKPLHAAGPTAISDPVIGVNCSDTDNIGVGWLPSAKRYAIFVRHDGPDAVGPGGPGTGAGRRVSVCRTDNLAGSWGRNAASDFSKAEPWCVGETEPCPLSARSCCEVVAQADAADPANLVDIYDTACAPTLRALCPCMVRRDELSGSAGRRCTRITCFCFHPSTSTPAPRPTARRSRRRRGDSATTA